ncbi:MAG TPA: UDP-N-acetylmuramate dehydrogenase [Mycobacteriales bacterium]|nr:UDP-N-acetylmuramate dehydrogenase [Mycobacteriales bacterium]
MNRPRPDRRDVPLAPLTTLRLGGPAARLVEATDEAGIVAAVRAADAEGTGVLLLGGGSNLVLADEGWAGLVVLLRSRGVSARRDGDRVLLDVAAGEPWDELVARTVAEGWSGLECLAGIPGLAGATPVQNVGAYGQEVAQTVHSVRVLDRQRGEVVRIEAARCGFAYRQSAFKGSVFRGTARYVVLSVTFALRPGCQSTARYAELATALGVPVGGTASLAATRDAVLALRRGKGMVLDSDDHDTWSAGSFFTNPVLSAAELATFAGRLPPGSGYPSWPAGDDRTKLSAAWLIQHAGFDRGYRRGTVGLSTKHTLALTNRGGARTSELLGLAREIRDGVRTRYGVTLRPEPLLVGATL